MELYQHFHIPRKDLCCIHVCRRSQRSRREWVHTRTSVPNVSAKSRAGREKNGEDSSWVPACSKTTLFWIVSSPANYYFHCLRAVPHIDISPKGEILSDATRHSDIDTTSTKMEKTKESTEKALNLLNIPREKKDIILNEEQEKAVVELLSVKDVFAILPTGFGKFWSIRSLFWRAQIANCRNVRGLGMNCCALSILGSLG